MRQNREKVAKIAYLHEFKSDFDKNTHDAFLYADSSYSWISEILKQIFFCYFFSYNKTKDNSIKSPKPNNFETMKVKVMKIYTTYPFIPSYHKKKFEALCMKNILFLFFPFEK